MKKLVSLLLTGVMALSLTACVDQYPEEVPTDTPNNEIAQVEHRIVATSNSTLWIMDALNIDLVGRCETPSDFPERYADLPTTGTGMAPDAEAIAMLEPTDVIGPDTLIENIQPGYDAAGFDYTFIDLQSVESFYESIELIGNKYGKTEEVDALLADYEQTLADFKAESAGKTPPKVMVLMGLPGAYIACTNNSYVGSLVNLTGAENVVKVDDEMNFVSWNTEELLALDPDIILLTAHGLPDLAMEMFTEEFLTNDIWRNFRAVENGAVYALEYETFGMSATFGWKDAFADLQEIFYEDTYESFVK